MSCGAGLLTRRLGNKRVILRILLSRCTHVQAVPIDYDQAAILYRQCRANGESVKKLVDCLIAAILGGGLIVLNL
jgi:predicted nucleic acid-binding protein